MGKTDSLVGKKYHHHTIYSASRHAEELVSLGYAVLISKGEHDDYWVEVVR